MITIENISRSFKEGKGALTVLENLSLSIEKGAKVALMGASGSGKTTLLQIIGGLDRATSGRIVIDQQEVSAFTGKALAAFRNNHLGYVFQFHHLLSDFTALENCFMPGMIRGDERSALVDRAKELLTTVGLNDRLSHHPAELSGGERQRVALARALFNNPSLILADEPTGNLDHENSQQFLDTVHDLNYKNGQTFLIATHDDEVARAMDYCLVLEGGTVHKRG